MNNSIQVNNPFSRIVLSKESSNEQVVAYFEGILKLYQSNEKYPVDLDDVWLLVYSEKGKAVRALKKNFFEGEDYHLAQKGKVINSSDIQNGVEIKYYLSIECFEFFIARKVREVFEVYRNVFQKIATGKVKVVASIPNFANPAEAARAWAEEYEQKMISTQRAEVAEQQILSLTSEIESMQQKVSYYDMILANKSTVVITQIAQDYGMSAVKFNQTLYDLHIQHKVNNQWILYAEHLGQGYVQSKPVTITHTGGYQSVKYNTEWTQKGRIFLYEELKKNNIIPLIEQ